SELVRISMFRDRDRSGSHDAGVSGAHALDILVRLGPIGLNQLATELFVDKSTASRLVAALEEKGYISRAIDPDDRRAVLLEVTPAGRDLQKRIHDDNLRDVAELLQSFSADTRQALTARLRQIACSFAIYAGVTDASVCLVPGDDRPIPFGADLRVAGPSDLQEALALLELVALPTEGVQHHFPGGFILARDPETETLIGLAGLESYGAAGLLRVVAVHPSYRGVGLGRSLALAAVKLAQVIGVRELYLLTPILENFFLRNGWEKIDHSDLPTVLAASGQLQGHSTATAMRLRLS
ncbi:MAG TPA: GNAT family N-acetyltransferase, partial [Chloroflexota bacterium]|nr:GNAT family N-acetyltransferase [Chloroflexota bacterium]